MARHEPLYNSKIIKTFMQYVHEYHPDVDMKSVLEQAGMNKYEVDDPAHWFSQEQVDRFHDTLVEKTQNPEIAREAGKYTVSSKSLGAAKQYTLGLMSPMAVYLLMEKLYPIMSRGATVKTRRLGSARVEIVSTPNPGVEEKPYQCENRLGTLESLTLWFTGKVATVEHPTCVHRGEGVCRYVITWEKAPSIVFKQLRNTLVFLGAPSLVGVLVAFPNLPWAICLLSFAVLVLALGLVIKSIDNRRLIDTVRMQGDAAKKLLDEINMRYDTSLLIKEVGRAASTLTDIEVLSEGVLDVIRNRLKYDRAVILIADTEKRSISHLAGYGYTPEQERLLEQTSFHLDKEESEGPFVQAFRAQKPIMLNGEWHENRRLSERTRAFVEMMDVKSFICVPIVYENESLGLLAVDNLKSKRPLTQSDVSLLQGVAYQTAVSIVNALSFQRLQKSEKKYRELVENANSIILRMTPSGRITFFNEFAQAFFGYEEAAILGRNVSGTLLPDTPEADRETEDLFVSLEEEPERPFVREMLNVRRGGETAWIAWTFRPVFEGGELREILCIGTDISELKEAEQEKSNLQSQLLEAQKMEAVGTLAGGIAHDFNNILQAISGYTQILLARRDPADPEYEKIQGIQRSSKRASELTKRLLIFSRKVESKLKPVDLNQEVDQVVRMLERTIPKMIEIQFHREENLRVVNADTVQIEQILMNLGVNARDAMPEGGILRFETSNVTRAGGPVERGGKTEARAYVCLTVSDTGQGMSREVIDRMFEPFFTTKERGQGTGLGLAMVYGIVKSHGGEIVCESEPGKGTTFHLFFPPLEQVAHQADSTPEVLPERGNGETVLLVDDESDIRVLGREILTQYGYNVLQARNGEEALAIYDEMPESVDLIILDLIMPGMGGIRFLDEVHRRNPRVKVVISTGYSLEGAMRKAIRGKVKGFIHKPYDYRQMLDMVHEVLASG